MEEVPSPGSTRYLGDRRDGVTKAGTLQAGTTHAQVVKFDRQGRGGWLPCHQSHYQDGVDGLLCTLPERGIRADRFGKKPEQKERCQGKGRRRGRAGEELTDGETAGRRREYGVRMRLAWAQGAE